MSGASRSSSSSSGSSSSRWRRASAFVATLGRWLAPKLRVGLSSSGRALWASALAVQRFGRAHRRLLLAALFRVSWWGALALWAYAAINLFDLRRSVDPDALLRATAVGALCCVPILLFASARRLRLGAWLLATLHVAVALLVHTIATG